MNTNQHAETSTRDPQLWEIARRRASFKHHFISYVVINTFLWSIWLFSGPQKDNHYPWPIWSTLGWGIGLFFHFLGAYIYPKENGVEREYQQLIRQKNN